MITAGAGDDSSRSFLITQTKHFIQGHVDFKGCVGIYEVLGMSREIQKMITSDATSNQIQDQAIKEGMITMQSDGLVKTLRGNTTLDEVLRVTRES